jgi:hypothetical protein
MAHGPKPKPVEERFWAMVDKRGSDDCWAWTGAHTPKGYGTFGIGGGRFQRAHRFAWTLAYGDPGMFHVLHRCDNPPCQNPAHLWLGTNADNVADRVAKGRTGDHAGEANPAAKLTRTQVEDIRRRYVRGRGPYDPGTSKELADRYGVTRTQILDIVRGKCWRAS